MREALIGLLREMRTDEIATLGVIASLFSDDLEEGLRRLKIAEESAHELLAATPRRGSTKAVELYSRVERQAQELAHGLTQIINQEKARLE